MYYKLYQASSQSHSDWSTACLRIPHPVQVTSQSVDWPHQACDACRLGSKFVLRTFLAFLNPVKDNDYFKIKYWKKIQFYQLIYIQMELH